MSRRTLLGLGLGASAFLLAGCNRFGIGGEPTASASSLDMIWWGDAARAEATEAMLAIFQEQHDGLTIKTEYQDSGPYSDKLATRFAGGDVPDLFNQRRDGLREYADRGALLDLNEHLDVLNLDDVPTTSPLGLVDGALYGIPAGLNAVGFVINRDLTAQYGVEIPDGDTWSWDDLWAFSKAVSDASGGQVYGVDLDFSTVQNLVVFIRQTGEEMYNEDGTFGASEETLADWFAMSLEQRKTGGLAPAGFIEVTGGATEQSPIATGLVAGQIIPTNNLKAYTDATGSPLELLRIPGEVQGARRGMSIDTSMYWSIGQQSPNKDTALQLLDFIVNSVEGNEAVGPTRGLPISTVVADAIASGLGEEDQRSIEYISGLGAEELPISRPDPIGGTTIQDALADIAVEVTFERTSPQDAAKQILQVASDTMGLG
ncbi:ABC transporter substrate-binding protein [Microbacterium sp. NPDC055683]